MNKQIGSKVIELVRGLFSVDDGAVLYNQRK